MLEQARNEMFKKHAAKTNAFVQITLSLKHEQRNEMQSKPRRIRLDVKGFQFKRAEKQQNMRPKTCRLQMQQIKKGKTSLLIEGVKVQDYSCNIMVKEHASE